MYVAGVDVGSTAVKAVVLLDGRIAGTNVISTGTDQEKTGFQSLSAAAQDAGVVDIEDISAMVATGYGRSMAKMADRTVTEITCHARGGRAFVEAAHVIVDIGGQDSKVIRLDEDGMVADFVMNDKCAAGTGRFLEVMAERLEVPLSDFGKMWRATRKPAMISSTCTVFAESEVVSLLSHGVAREPIIRGLCDAVADRLAGMVHRVGLATEVVMTGGVSRNDGVRLSLERKLGLKVSVPSMSQFAGAYGAAIIAFELAEKGR